jgi:hypothetical protein
MIALGGEDSKNSTYEAFNRNNSIKSTNIRIYDSCEELEEDR